MYIKSILFSALLTCGTLCADDKFYTTLAKYSERAQCIVILQYFLSSNYDYDTKLEERINTCATIIKTSLDPIDALATAWRESNFLDVVDHTNTSYGPMQFIKALWCDEKTWGIVDCDHLKRGIWVHNFHFQKYKNERTRFCAYIGAKDCSSNKIHVKWQEHLKRRKAIKKLYVFRQHQQMD
jgi:hypothetical protein